MTGLEIIGLCFALWFALGAIAWQFVAGAYYLAHYKIFKSNYVREMIAREGLRPDPLSVIFSGLIGIIIALIWCRDKEYGYITFWKVTKMLKERGDEGG